jgi:hypothetical protein
LVQTSKFVDTRANFICQASNFSLMACLIS